MSPATKANACGRANHRLCHERNINISNGIKNRKNVTPSLLDKSMDASANTTNEEHARLSRLSRQGGLRRSPRGETSKLHLTSAQLGLVERIVGGDGTTRRLVIAAMHMGTGKTLASLAALCVLRARSPNRPIRVLFVVPKSTLYSTWRKQLRYFTHLDVDDVRVVTYPRLQNAFMKSYRKKPKGGWERTVRNVLLDKYRDLVVFDESHTLRNPHTILGQAAATLSKRAARVLCMTGTPIHNGPEDASGQLCAMGSGNQLEDSALFGKRAALNRDAVRDFTERFVYTSSLLEAGITLPLKHSETVWVDHAFSKAEAEQYNESLVAIQGANIKKAPGAMKHHMLILRQLCVEPALHHKHGRDTFDDEALRRTVAAPGPKLRATLALVRRLVYEGHSKVVVVSEFVTLLDVFRDLALEHLGEDSLCFDGRLGAAARGKMVEEFLTGGARLLCLSLGAGAYGLNLTPGPTAMIILDVWFNPAVHRQVEARIHRTGQDKEVKIFTLVTRDSVEAAILGTHAGKEACALALLTGANDDSAKPNDVKRIAETCTQMKHKRLENE